MDTPVAGVITNDYEIQCIGKIKNYIEEYKKLINIDESKTFHSFETNLPFILQNTIIHLKYGEIFNNLENNSPNMRVDCITQMNELYLSCIGADGSDKVFETMHIDGPFHLLPFCKVLRTIIAIQGNQSIYTDFPMIHKSYSLLTNEFIAFDYNRDIHYIFKNANIIDKNNRIILKFHYIITPNFLPYFVVEFYKKLHIIYNSFMRILFLKSQTENKCLSFIINKGTVIYCHFFYHIGYWNLFMILCSICKLYGFF
jgi:hypothetical protein